MHILITGNPVEGLCFTGPFTSHDEAVKHGEEIGGDWWVAPLHSNKGVTE